MSNYPLGSVASPTIVSRSATSSALHRSIPYPAIMGVLNVTLDSFSDGGDYANPKEAIERAKVMIEEGADIIDIGGESTRPGSNPISDQEELDRIMPVLTYLQQYKKERLISVDTSKPTVMREVIAAGADLINDVNALQAPGAIDAVANQPVYLCLMHKQGQPISMQANPHYTDVRKTVADFLSKRVADCESAGIARDRLIIDPGFGFGKTTQHNLQLLHSLEQLACLKLPILVGWSRKSSIGEVINQPVNQRLYGSLAVAVIAFLKGASVIRTHDVRPTREAILMAQAVNNQRVN